MTSIRLTKKHELVTPYTSAATRASTLKGLAISELAYKYNATVIIKTYNLI